jgi:hypothetical protein
MLREGERLSSDAPMSYNPLFESGSSNSGQYSDVPLEMRACSLEQLSALVVGDLSNPSTFAHLASSIVAVNEGMGREEW